MDLLDWAFTWLMKACRVWQASAVLGGVWARSLSKELTLVEKLEPGPTPVTAVSKFWAWPAAPTTVTVKEAVTWLKALSVVVQLMVVAPMANSSPEAGVQVVV